MIEGFTTKPRYDKCLEDFLEVSSFLKRDHSDIGLFSVYRL